MCFMKYPRTAEVSWNIQGHRQKNNSEKIIGG